MLRTLPSRWKRVGDGSVKIGVAVVLMRNSHAVAQVAIGVDWLSIQAAGDRGPRMDAPIYMKQISAADRERITRMATEMPNQRAAGQRP